VKSLQKPDYDLYRTDFKVIRGIHYTLITILVLVILYIIFK